MSKILITGVAGLIGSHLADKLLAEGHTVVGVDSLIGGYADNIPVHDQFKFCKFDVNVVDALTHAMIGCDVVYHCAALAYEGLSVVSPYLVASSIINGTLSVTTAAIRCGVKRIINCSSMARYGRNSVPFRESMTPNPVDPYGLAKVAAEDQLNGLSKIYGFTLVHVVPHNVIGPRQRYDDPFRNVAGIMINRVLQGKPPIIYSNGLQVRCFSFIQDVVGSLVKLLYASVASCEVFNIGPDDTDSVPINIRELAMLIMAVAGVDNLTPEYHPARPCEVREAYCSSEKIRRRLGYRTVTTLEAGITKMVEYVRQRGPLPFDYRLPIEIDGPLTPKVWKERLL